MDPIDTRENLAPLFQKKLARTNTGTSVDTTNAQPTAAAVHQPGRNSTPGTTQIVLEQQLRSKVKQLKQQAATQQNIDHSVIGTLLASEFNDALYFEPKFAALVQRVQQHLKDEPALNAALQKIIDQLGQ